MWRNEYVVMCSYGMAKVFTNSNPCIHVHLRGDRDAGDQRVEYLRNIDYLTKKYLIMYNWSDS